MKSKARSNRVTVYLTADSKAIPSYFNTHDPSPIYARQLSHEFEQYLTNSIARANRYSVINYKVICLTKIDTLFTDPLLEAIRRHYTLKKTLKHKEFSKFKRRAYWLLGFSFVVVMICQGLLPYVIDEAHRAHSAFSNALDVFSWVILWKPIERLIFYWNPFLKEIDILDKMIHAKSIVIENEKEVNTYQSESSLSVVTGG
jgi:hypothetical protein